MNIGGNNYFDNETIPKQFERLFQLLYFKVAYKNRDFVFLVDNARAHTAAEYSANDFAMKPGGRCPVDAIEYVDGQNVKITIEYYDDDGESQGLLKLVKELNLDILQNCKLLEYKEIVSEHAAFKNVSET
ncbi:unnamed protein product [Rotaria magnacalcarata]|nr:unnamed protein product [Rotaria magnacalcarata]CAF2215183.1 unnamed protein product [Rotaria magnacalcarata]CAF4291160.1 unnamed protein product [Rotaria magnacalcarata]